MTKTELFIELAKPDKNGKSRWVLATEFVDDYKDLQLGNGGSWCRASYSLAKKYIIEFDKSKTSENSIDAIRLNGFNTEKTFNQNIHQDIKDFYKSKNCVMLGINGNSENTRIEINHKDGRKDDHRIYDTKTQKLEEFQPLTKAANDAKRLICKRCKETNKRWNAKNLKGNPYPYYKGAEEYTKELGCIDCYKYVSVEHSKTSVVKISKEVTKNIKKKLYTGD